MESKPFRIGIALCTLLALLTAGCQTTYYAVWEKLGKEKRHLLRSNVEQMSVEQQEASEQFQGVLTRMREMYGFSGGDLEHFYHQLSDEYQESEERAKKVRKRIRDVEHIGADLFEEWQEEIDQITNAEMRASSKRSLAATKQRFATLQKAMAQAEKSMEPVLVNLNNYVLYLKHNLNAQAIGALRKEVTDIETEVSGLLADMNHSITEARQFLKHLP